MVKYGRVVYAFVPAHFETIAKPSGPRPVLLSYYYLRNKENNGLKELEKWRKYSQPWTLIIDSGVYTLRAKLRLGISATSGRVKDFTKQDFEYVYNMTLQKKDKIDHHVRDYAQFLKDAEGFYDIAVEMDMDDWMGVQYSDIYYQWLCEKVSSTKIMRVWHQSGRNWDDWVRWCKDPTQPYLCIEGGTILGRNIDLYNKFIFEAHNYDKKVHILALTIPQILRDTPVNTTDSSTWVNGGRYATVKVPTLGEVCFSTETDLSKVTASSARHYTTLSKESLNYCLEYFKTIGFTMEETLATGSQGFINRSIMTLYYYDEYVDLPYIPKTIHESIF